MYLFQFPPVLPPLEVAAEPAGPGGVKTEPDDTVMVDAPPAGAAAAKPTVDLTRDDDDYFGETLAKAGGFVGELKVRRSGRVELDWGGQTLELRPGGGVEFVTTAVLVDEFDQ